MSQGVWGCETTAQTHLSVLPSGLLQSKQNRAAPGATDEEEPMKKTTTKLTIRTNVKAGGVRLNHTHARKLVIRTAVKAGGVSLNHAQSRA